MTDCHYLIRMANVLPSTQRELCSRLHSPDVCHTHPEATVWASTHGYNLPCTSLVSLSKARPSPRPQVLAETLKVQWRDYNKIIPTRISWGVGVGQSKRSPVVLCRMNECQRESWHGGLTMHL